MVVINMQEQDIINGYKLLTILTPKHTNYLVLLNSKGITLKYALLKYQ